MRLAINAISLAPGGGLTGLLGYLNAWRELGSPLKITVLASRPAVLDAVRACRPDIDIEPCMVNESRAKRFVFERFRLGRHVEQTGADVVMTTNSLVGRCNIPQLVHMRNLWRFVHPTLWAAWREKGISKVIRDWNTQRTLRRSICNAYISDYLRCKAEEIVPQSAPYNHVVHNGLDHAVIESAERVEPLWQGKGHLLAIQGADSHKDNATLVRTLAELVGLRPEADWRLRIAGGGDWTFYQRLAENLGVREQIDWLGFQGPAQIDELLRESLCLIFTSILEGFGNPPLEAMARKCPVVACNSTAVPEVIGDAGILVPPGDEKAFAQGILRLYDDHVYRQILVAKGLQRIRKFCWIDSANKMRNLFALVAR